MSAIDDAGVSSMVTLTRRFAPETRAFLDAVRGADVATVSATWLSGALLGGEYAGSTWRQAGGALMDVGPHVLDLAIEVLGPITSVATARRDDASDTWSLALDHGSGRPEAGLDDSGRPEAGRDDSGRPEAGRDDSGRPEAGRDDSGRPEAGRGDSCRTSVVTLSMRTPVRPSVLRVSASGTDGLIELSDRTTPPDRCYAVLLDEFLQSVRTGTRHGCSAHRGLELQRVIDECRRALQK